MTGTTQHNSDPPPPPLPRRAPACLPRRLSAAWRMAEAIRTERERTAGPGCDVAHDPTPPSTPPRGVKRMASLFVGSLVW